LETNERVQKLVDVARGKHNILVCTHNNPDPDALACAAGVRLLLGKLLKVKPKVVYGGVVGRAENRAMINILRLNVRPFDKRMLGKKTTVILVDTQPGASNNPLPRGFVPAAVLDHHKPIRRMTGLCDFSDIRPDYGSASTIVMEYIRAAGIEPNARIATALLYGIQTDTLGIGRSGLKQDVQAMQYLFSLASLPLLHKIQNPKLPREYLYVFADAIERSRVIKDVLTCRLDDIASPDAIAEMSDFLLKAEGIGWVLVTGMHNGDLLFSLRTSGKSRTAGDLVRRIAGTKGAAGGHVRSAGGKIHLKEGSSKEDIMGSYHALSAKLEQRLYSSLKRTGEPRRFRPHPEPDRGNCSAVSDSN